jgi:hypothetical protein
MIDQLASLNTQFPLFSLSSMSDKMALQHVSDSHHAGREHENARRVGDYNAFHKYWIKECYSIATIWFIVINNFASAREIILASLKV